MDIPDYSVAVSNLTERVLWRTCIILTYNDIIRQFDYSSATTKMGGLDTVSNGPLATILGNDAFTGFVVPFLEE